MDTRVFRRVQRYGWDAATNAYDRGWVPQLERLTESCVARANLRAGERVVDLATGTGVGAFAAARAVGAAGSHALVVRLAERLIPLLEFRAPAPFFFRMTVPHRDDVPPIASRRPHQHHHAAPQISR